MKKCISMILCIILCISMCMPCYAKTNTRGDELLNQATMREPYISPNPYVTPCVAAIFAEMTPDMTPAEKVQFCYDWLIYNCHYITDEDMANSQTIPDFYDYYNNNAFCENSEVDASTYQMIVEHYGDCIVYSKAFVGLTRAMGFDSHVVYGTVKKRDGSDTGHMWAEITINGTECYFDPQIEDNNLLRIK